MHQEAVCSHQLSILHIVSVYAKVGSQEIPGVTDKFGLGVQNEEEQRLIVFWQENALVIAKHPFSTTQEMTLHMDITKWSIPILN